MSVINNFPKIKDCIFEAKSYNELKLSNCLIYCDIPYKNSKKNYYDTSFNYDDFYNWVKLNSKSNKIFISENFMPDDFKIIWKKEYNRTLGARNNIVSIEKLYTI